jgi:peptide/nickel transport system ATP-binding protein/oligopeptide transport system ATP-binding protein
MYLGKIFELGTTEAVLKNSAHPYTKALISATPDISRKKISNRILLRGDVESGTALPTGCRFNQRCPEKKGSICEKTEPRWIKLDKEHYAACHLLG